MKLAAFSLVVLTGCAAPTYWAKPGSDRQTFNMDAGRCKQQAMAYNATTFNQNVQQESAMAGWIPPGRGSVALAATSGRVVGEGFENAAGASREQEFFNACMYGLGWHLEQR